MDARRRSDFLIGRLAAARAIAELGLEPRPVTRNGRAPDFGCAARGSISHSHGLAVALVMPASGAAGVGVDLELGRLRPQAARSLPTPEEAPWIAQATSAGEHTQRATILFAVKESAYKALAPSADDPLSLRAIEVDCANPGGPVAARVVPIGGGVGHREVSFEVGWVCQGGVLLAWAVHARERTLEPAASE